MKLAVVLAGAFCLQACDATSCDEADEAYLTIRLRDTRSGDPVCAADVDVTVDNQPLPIASSLTPQACVLERSIGRPGKYSVTVDAPGFEMKTATFERDPDECGQVESIDLVIELEPK